MPHADMLCTLRAHCVIQSVDWKIDAKGISASQLYVKTCDESASHVAKMTASGIDGLAHPHKALHA
eukprot:361845-Chlamydomonas_euryale.AAC.4